MTPPVMVMLLAPSLAMPMPVNAAGSVSPLCSVTPVRSMEVLDVAAMMTPRSERSLMS